MPHGAVFDAHVGPHVSHHAIPGVKADPHFHGGNARVGVFQVHPKAGQLHVHGAGHRVTRMVRVGCGRPENREHAVPEKVDHVSAVA